MKKTEINNLSLFDLKEKKRELINILKNLEQEMENLMGEANEYLDLLFETEYGYMELDKIDKHFLMKDLKEVRDEMEEILKNVYKFEKQLKQINMLIFEKEGNSYKKS